MSALTEPKNRPTPRRAPRRYSPTEAERALQEAFIGRGRTPGVLRSSEEAHWPWERERLEEGRKAAKAHNGPWGAERAKRLLRRADWAAARSHARRVRQAR